MNFTRDDQIALALYNIGVKKARDAYAADQAGRADAATDCPSKAAGACRVAREDQRRYRERKKK